MNRTAHSAGTASLHASSRLLTRTFVLACAVQLTGSLAGAMYILFPLFVRSLGGTETTIGVLAGLGAASAVAIRWPLGVLLDRVGRKPIMIAATLCHMASSVGFLFVGELGRWCELLVMLNAMAAGAMFTSFVTYAADIVPVTRRAQGLAWFGMWGMMANGLSPLLGEWLQRTGGFQAYFLAAAALASACASIIVWLPNPRMQRFEVAPTESRQRLHSGFVFLLALTMLFGAAEASVFTFLAPFLTSQGEGNVGPVFFAYAGAAVLVRVVSSHLPDRIGRLRVRAASFTLYGAALLAIPRISGELPHLVTGVLAGIGHGYAFPILAALVVDLAGGRRGRAVSWFTAMFDVGHSLSNPVLGALAEHFGYRAMYTVVGAFALASAALIVRGGRQRPAQPSTSIT